LGIKKEDEPAEDQDEGGEESDGSGDSGDDSSDAGQASSGTAQPQSQIPEEDYTTAVHDDTEPKYEPEETDFDDEEGVAPSLVPVIIVGAVALAVGLIVGGLTASVSGKNQLYNMKVREAGQLSEALAPVQGNIVALNNSLQAITIDGYTPEFNTAVEGLYKDKPAEAFLLRPSDLAAAASVLSIDEQLARRLINYAVNTQSLQDQVNRHLAAVQRDQEDLESEAAGEEDDKNYAIIFDSNEQGNRWETFQENTEENAYQPIGGLKVTYDSLEVETIGEGDDARYVYTVRMPSGSEQKVPLYEVIPMPREQLVQSATTETATSRFVGRAQRIKEAISTLAQQGNALLQQIEDEAANSERFTL
jgi:hypothetical protein